MKILGLKISGEIQSNNCNHVVEFYARLRRIAERFFLKVFNWDEGSSRVRQQVRVCSSDTGCCAKKFFQLKKDQVQSWPHSSDVPMITLYSWFAV